VGKKSKHYKMDNPTNILLAVKTVPELKRIAKNMGIVGFSTMRKQELIRCILAAIRFKGMPHIRFVGVNYD
jgi:hypothetical protein